MTEWLVLTAWWMNLEIETNRDWFETASGRIGMLNLFRESSSAGVKQNSEIFSTKASTFLGYRILTPAQMLSVWRQNACGLN